MIFSPVAAFVADSFSPYERLVTIVASVKNIVKVFVSLIRIICLHLLINFAKILRLTSENKDRKMKLITASMIVFSLFSGPAFSALTQADIDKIRLIVKEEVETAVARSESRTKEYLEASESRTKEYVSQEIAKVNTTLSEMDKRLTGEIRSLDKQLNNLFMLVLALVAFIAVVIGVPQIIVALQRKEVRAQDEKIEAQQKQIEALEKEMAIYRQERT